VVEYIADTLQESLLPVQLPEIPGVQAAVDFRPASERHVVGGDFYDVFQSDDGSWVVVVGDVVGKGAPAAAVTGLARYTLRAAAMQDSSPSRVLEFLNEAIRRQRPNEFCSVALARLEPNGSRGATAVLAAGGHPLPMVLRADGAVEQVGLHGTLLGAFPDPELSEATVELHPGDALVLYTDGLTDAYAPGRTVTHADLEEALRPHGGRPAPEITTGVTQALLGVNGEQPRDDIALLVLRVPPAAVAPEREVVVTLSGELEAVPSARRALQQLAPLLEPDLLENVGLLVSELVTNSIRYARTPGPASIELRASVFDDLVRVEVTDHGPGFEARANEPSSQHESGWGLYLVDQLSDRWGVSRVGGTAAWFEIDRVG
jgi:anti-sigma regulatory factor (Ser/Thr protein kinase)